MTANSADFGLNTPVMQMGGEPLLAELREAAPLCKTGDVVVTGAPGLPADICIHAVAPTYTAQFADAASEALHLAYFNCLAAAHQRKVASIALPCLYTDQNSFPREQGAHPKTTALLPIRTALGRTRPRLRPEAHPSVFIRRLPLASPRVPSPTCLAAAFGAATPAPRRARGVQNHPSFPGEFPLQFPGARRALHPPPRRLCGLQEAPAPLLPAKRPRGPSLRGAAERGGRREHTRRPHRPLIEGASRGGLRRAVCACVGVPAHRPPRWQQCAGVLFIMPKAVCL